MSLRAISVWSLVFALVLGGLYHIRYQAQAALRLQQDLADALQNAGQANALLEAEWSSLNDPRHLQKLANVHLDLVPLEARQLNPDHRTAVSSATAIMER